MAVAVHQSTGNIDRYQSTTGWVYTGAGIIGGKIEKNFWHMLSP